jgi:hypothetical protein
MNGLGQIRSYYEIKKQMKLEETNAPHPSLDSVILREEDLNAKSN